MIVAYLLAAAAFELALALERSASPDGEGFVLLFALLAMLVGAVLVVRRVPVRGLIAPAAALFVVARFYTGDPYNEPTFQSYANSGMFPPSWIYFLVGVAVLAGLATQLWRRAVAFESVVVLGLLLLTALFMGAGH